MIRALMEMALEALVGVAYWRARAEAAEARAEIAETEVAAGRAIDRQRMRDVERLRTGRYWS